MLFNIACYNYAVVFCSGHSSTVWSISFNATGDKMVTSRYQPSSILALSFFDYIYTTIVHSCFIRMDIFICALLM